jgi:hypothetical protein
MLEQLDFGMLRSGPCATKTKRRKVGRVLTLVPPVGPRLTDFSPVALPRSALLRNSLGITLTPCHVSKFVSLETSVQIHQSVREEDVFILQSPSPPTSTTT